MQQLTPYIGADALWRTPMIHALRGDGSYPTAASLALDTGATPTFARNCVAYRDYWDGSDRKLVEVAANVPRWCTRKDSGGTLRSGLLIEDEATNLCHQSSLSTGWSASRCSIAASDVIAPNSAYMQKIVEDGTTGSRYIVETTAGITVNNGATYAVSLFAKKINRNWVLTDFYFTVNPGINVPNAFFNLDTGAVGNKKYVIDAGIENWGGGIFRCWMVFTADRDSLVVARIRPATNNGVFTYEGTNGLDAIAAYGYQIGVGSYPSSYIATSGASATRLRDEYRLNIGDRMRQRGSIVYSILRSNFNLLQNITSLSIHDGTADNRITSTILASGDALSTTVVAGGVTQASITGATDVVDGNQHTVAVSWEPNNICQFLDGAADGVPDTSATIPSSLTTLTLGDHVGAGQSGAIVSDLKLYSRPGVTS